MPRVIGMCLATAGRDCDLLGCRETGRPPAPNSALCGLSGCSETGTAVLFPIFGGMEGFPGLPRFSGRAQGIPRLGRRVLHYFTGKHHFPQTYVFVQVLALVPVVQVNELSRSLLLSVHPGSHVLAASLRVQIGALPVPGGDRGTQPGDPKHENPPRCVGRPFTKG